MRDIRQKDPVYVKAVKSNINEKILAFNRYQYLHPNLKIRKESERSKHVNPVDIT